LEIQQLLVDEIMNFVDGFVRKAKVVIDGVERDYDITFRLRESDEMRFMIFIEDLDNVTISNARLVDAQGRSLQVKGMNVQKDGDGRMIVFKIKFNIQGA
jgi:hypothetical protein